MNGYNRIQRETLLGRNLEHEVFTRITARMAGADLSRPGGLAALTQALCDNRQLWTALAVDLSLPGNTCPDDVKATLLSLAAFVERQTPKALNGEADASALIDINRNIIGGLEPRSDQQAA